MRPKQETFMRGNSGRCVRVMAVLLTISGVLRAADRYYVGPDTGSWNNPANWSATPGGAGGAGVPTSADLAYITHADAFSRAITIDANVAANSLRMGNTISADGVFQSLPGSDMAIKYESIGYTAGSRGIHAQYGGTNTIGFAGGLHGI